MAKAKVELVDDTWGDAEDDLGDIQLDGTLDDMPEPELLPEGFYPAEIVDVEKRMNSKGTASIFSVKFVIKPDSYPADFDVSNYPEGKYLYFSMLRVPTPGDRRAFSNLKKFMQTIGVPTDVDTIRPSEWVGRPVKLGVEHSTYQGTTRESIAMNGVLKAD